MNHILFFLFSMMEYMAVFYLSFALFSIVFKHFIPQLLISSFVLTCSSFIMRSLKLDMYDVLLQILIFILLIRFVFRINGYYAVIISFGYICAVVIQMVSFNLLYQVGLLGQISSFSGGTYIIQTISALLVVLLAVFLKKKDWRYSFVPTKVHIKVSLTWLNSLLLLFVLLEISIIVISYYYFLNAFSPSHGIFALILFLVAGALPYLLLKRELS